MWFFPVSTIQEEYLNGKMSSLAGLKKSYWISRNSTYFGLFWPLGSTFKVDFLNGQAQNQEILGQIPGQVV